MQGSLGLRQARPGGRASRRPQNIGERCIKRKPALKGWASQVRAGAVLRAPMPRRANRMQRFCWIELEIATPDIKRDVLKSRRHRLFWRVILSDKQSPLFGITRRHKATLRE